MGLSVKWRFGSQLRRFTVKEVQGEQLFVSLQNEIRGIVGHAVDIFWEDDEGDLIIIQSESELTEAMNFRADDVLRLVSKEEEQPVLTERTVQTEKSKAEQDQDQETIHGAAHPGVTCDGCDALIFGHRFKCIICHDYDLCQKCEAQGVHGFHGMLRIVDPDITVIPWGARLRTHRRPSRHRPFDHMGNERDFHHREHPWMRRDQLKDSVNKGVQFLTELGQTVSTALSNMGIDTTYEVRVENDDKNKATAPTAEANTAPTAPHEPFRVPRLPTEPLAPEPQLPEVPVANVAPPAPTTIPRVHRGQNRTDGYRSVKEINKQEKMKKLEELRKSKAVHMESMLREADQQARRNYPTFEVRTPPAAERFENNHNYDMFGRRLRDGYPTAPSAEESRQFQWRCFRDLRGRSFAPEPNTDFDPFGRNTDDSDVFGGGRAGFSPFGRHSCRPGPTVLKRSTGNELFGELDPFAPPAGVVAPPRKVTREETQTDASEAVENKMSEMLIDIPRQIANNNEKKAEKTIDIPNSDSVAVEIKREVREEPEEENNLVDLNEHTGLVFRSGSESSLGSDLVNVDMTMCEISSVDNSLEDALDQLNVSNTVELANDTSVLYPELQEQNADVEIFMDAVETNPHESVIRQLTAMGFPEPECRRAILHCGAELGKCLDFLTGTSFAQ